MINDSKAIDRLLTETKRWAIVGLSAKPERASHRVAARLQSIGMTIIPVNPLEDQILGEKSYPDLASIPEKVDVVDVFRRSELAGVHVDEAVEIEAGAVWLQLNVIDEAAADRAVEAGLDVVMDRCPAIELRRRGR
jgi:predicted CoA-binding protein